MKLVYRGVSYDYNPPQVPTYDSGNLGTYRGLDVRFRNPKKALVLQPTLDLKYRGVAYRPGETAAATAPRPQPVPATRPVGSITQKARALMLNRHREVGRRQQTMLNRLAAEVGLTDVSTSISRIQGKMQHDLAIAYQPSAAALS